MSIAEVVDDYCELIVEVGDNRCWPCKSNRGNPPLDTTDQLILDIISSAIIQIKTDVKPNTTIKITNLTNYPQMSET